VQETDKVENKNEVTMIKHIVLIKLKDKHKTQNGLEIKELLEQLVSKIDVLIDMEVGINFDNATRAMDISLYTTFKSKEDLKIYATHHEHLKVVEVIKNCSEYTKVVDYEVV
jgi:hypothetical protein